jgi:hypothetical protein
VHPEVVGKVGWVRPLGGRTAVLAGEGEVVRPNTVSIRCGGWEGPRTPEKNETVILVIYGCFWLFLIQIFAVTHWNKAV